MNEDVRNGSVALISATSVILAISVISVISFISVISAQIFEESQTYQEFEMLRILTFSKNEICSNFHFLLKFKMFQESEI